MDLSTLRMHQFLGKVETFFIQYIIAVRLTFTIFLQPIDIRYNNQLISFRDSKF